MKKRRKWSAFLIMLLMLITFCSIHTASFSVQAMEKELPDLGRKGSITVAVKDPETKNPITTGIMTLRQVASVKVDDGNYTFAYTEAFSACTYPLDNLDSQDLAEALAIYSGENAVAGKDSSINAEGNVIFENLEPGLYLITYAASKENEPIMNPFLVTIPLTKGKELTYDVDATPKLEISTSPKPDNPDGPGKQDAPDEPDNPDKPGTSGTDHSTTGHSGSSSKGHSVLPQTGQLWWPVPVLTCLGLLFIAFGWKRKKS